MTTLKEKKIDCSHWHPKANQSVVEISTLLFLFKF